MWDSIFKNRCRIWTPRFALCFAWCLAKPAAFWGSAGQAGQRPGAGCPWPAAVAEAGGPGGLRSRPCAPEGQPRRPRCSDPAPVDFQRC